MPMESVDITIRRYGRAGYAASIAQRDQVARRFARRPRLSVWRPSDWMSGPVIDRAAERDRGSPGRGGCQEGPVRSAASARSAGAAAGWDAMALVYLVQHGDKEPLPGDPGLTAWGRRQAAVTGRWLR